MLSMGRVLGVLAVLGVVAGCAATFPAVPGKGGPAWLELTSEHFTVLTDADHATARALVSQMEQVRQVVVGAAFPAAVRGRILVFALRDDGELSLTRTERESRAFAGTAGRPMFQPFVVLSTIGFVMPDVFSARHSNASSVGLSSTTRITRLFTSSFSAIDAATLLPNFRSGICSRC